MNEYFVKYVVKYYQTMPETRTCFVKAESGEEAWNKIQGEFVSKNENSLFSKKLDYLCLEDIRRL